jgi:plasmid stabilization system protein ParE
LKRRRVVWTEKATRSLDFFCDYIRNNSPSAAKRVKREIVLTAKELAVYPERYQLDEILSDPTHNIRRFFRWSYRVVYQVHEKEVVILDVFHTSAENSEDE